MDVVTATLNSTELAAVNQARTERGLPPLGAYARAIQASAAYRAPSHEPPPSGFAQEVVNAIAVRLGNRACRKPPEPEKSEPAPDPSTFAGQLAIAIKRRRKGYAAPKPWTTAK